MTLNLTQLVLDGIVILREPQDATTAAPRERLALVAPTLGRYLVGATAGGLGYLIAGFHGGFMPAAVLLLLMMFVGEESGLSAAGSTSAGETTTDRSDLTSGFECHPRFPVAS